MRIIDFDAIVNQVIGGQWGSDSDIEFNNLSAVFGPITSKLIQEIAFEKVMNQKETKSKVQKEDNPIGGNKTLSVKKIPLDETLNILLTLNTIKESSNTIYYRNMKDSVSELDIIAGCNTIINELIKRIKESI